MPPETVELLDRLVLHEIDTTIVPDLPLGWPFALSRWPVARQWDEAPTRAQRAVAFLQIGRLTLTVLEDGDDETVLYGRILASIGLRWRETSACYQIVCDAIANVKTPKMGRAMALGIEGDEEPGLFGEDDV